MRHALFVLVLIVSIPAHALKRVTPAHDASSIPPTALLREFIGGSAYEY